MRAEVRIECETAERARALEASLSPENAGFLQTSIDGSTLVLRAEAATPLALLHTLDDALACLGAAERSSRIARP